MIRFHFCKAFLKKIKGQSFERSVLAKFDDLSAKSRLVNTGMLHDYGNGLYFLRIHFPLSKTIISKEIIDGATVYFVRDFLPEKDEGFYFKSYIHPHLKTGAWSKNNTLKDYDVESFRLERDSLIKLNSQEKLTPQKPPVEITKWLDDYTLIIKYEIFESEDWVKYSLSKNRKEGMRDEDVKSFANLLNQIINSPDKVTIESVGTSNSIIKYIATSGNFGIIFSKFRIDDTDRFLLYNAGHIKFQSEYWKNAINEIEKEEFKFETSIDGLARFSFRAYPKWTVINDDLWFAIQKNSEFSNLSLTQDQLMFFRDFTFPQYINGQAGSGKSTMLYYLFSNAYYYKCLGLIGGDIIFLTENKLLLDHTRKAVYDLLNNNPEFEGLTTENLSNVENHFSSFKDFLINLVPVEDKDLFPNFKYLNFSKFKELYEESYLKNSIKRKFSAEESWFTITTYIYGYDNSKIITSDDYENEVYLKSQKIPKEKFKGIEDNVLPFYEKLLDESGYWDKLKILRYLETNQVAIPKNSIVFCDEAQDFCRVELRFILNLSEYLGYDLSEMEQFPVLFAGDANQTVNPTGFREREMTEMLYTELKELSQFEYKKAESVYNPLYNYRSKQPVVTLANFVQYYRKKHFDIRLVRPQIPKRPEVYDEPMPNLFFNYTDILENVELAEDLIEKIKYKIFIIPTDKEDSEQFIANNEILQKVEKAEIKTSIEAKGAEYNQVVLYGFGDYYFNNFGSITNGVVSEESDNFKRSYFFNKLYVAITRAQNELIIIDSKDGENQFWAKIINEAEVSGQYWTVLNNLKESTIAYKPGTLKDVLESSPEDARFNAEQDKIQGIYDQNPSRLKVAANQFLKIGNKKQYFLCLALSREYKDDWKKAAEYYLNSEFKQSKLEEASRCYFAGMYFDEIITNIGTKLKSNEQDVRLIISRLMSSSKISKNNDKPLDYKLSANDIKTLDSNRQVLRETIDKIYWRDLFIEKLVRNFYLNGDIEIKRDLAEIFNAIAKEKDLDLWNIIGQLNYSIENFDKAIEAWDRLNDYNFEEYVLSKVNIATKNNDTLSEIVWLFKSIDFSKSETEKSKIENKIISIFEKNNENLVEEDSLFLLYVYYSYLLQNPELIDIHEIGERVEKYFEVNDKFILLDVYNKLIKDNRLSPKTREFIIARWFKLNEKIYSAEEQFNEIKVKALNIELSELINSNTNKFKNYTIKEISSISKYPEKIVFNPPNHFSNIEVSGFRQFENIKLNNLGKFNLIVGDNNVGKTSLLESLLFDFNKEKYFLNLAYAFIERKNMPRYLDTKSNADQIFIPTNFAESFFCEKLEDKKIEYLITENRNQWKYEIRRLELSELKESLNQNSGIDLFDFYGFISNSNIESIEIPILLKKVNPAESIETPFIPFGKGFNKDLAQVYSDKIDKIKNIREDFLTKMKVFIPEIDRIIVDTENGEILIEEINKGVGSFLHQYGEGANKLFRILVQISLQKDGKILIDEVDAGVHHTRFNEFWRTILHFASINNTQVFATTHNLECISQFHQILHLDEFKEMQDDSRVITLVKLPDDSVKSYTRIFDEFDYELENNIELRGE